MRDAAALERSIRLLGRVAFEPGADIAALWRDWEAAVDLDEVTWDEHRLLVSAVGRLERDGVVQRDAARLRGIRRLAWTRNQMRLAGGREAIRLLRRAGIPAMLLKGAALIAAGLASPRDRVLLDVDLLVSPTDFLRAFQALRAAGWQREPYPFPDPYLHVAHYAHSHAAPLTAEGEREVDLHRLSNQVTRYAGFDREMWEAAGVVDFQGVEARLPAPADLLLHVLLHGIQARHGGVLTWQGDARLLLGRGDVDWQRFLDRTRRHLLQRLVGRAFEVLGERGIFPPDGVVAALRAMPADELLEHECRVLERQGFADEPAANALFDRVQARRAGGEPLLHRQPRPRNGRRRWPGLRRGSALPIAVEGTAEAVTCRIAAAGGATVSGEDVGKGCRRLTLVGELAAHPAGSGRRRQHLHFSVDGRWLGRWRVAQGPQPRRVALASLVDAEAWAAIRRLGLTVHPGIDPATEGLSALAIFRPLALHVRGGVSWPGA
ncbi:MAG: nucleotidyltransferase family protein [Azospirillaceae bacterium]